MNISIIIPVYNDAKVINETIYRIEQNKIDGYEIEIILVDNGSQDNIQKIAENLNVKLIAENSNLNSPYSARNRGIEASKGDIIVLLDATCRPTKNWLLNGINLLTDDRFNADIVAGNVKFDFQGNPTAGKIYDSLTNIKMKESVLEKNIAKTANLFIKREIFDKIGLFPEGVRSGADVRWTKKATSKGFKLIFSDDAMVCKIARTYKELLIKQRRVALHQPLIWFEQDKKVLLRRYCLFKALVPPRRKNIKKLIYTKGNQDMLNYINRLVFISWVIKINMWFYNFVGLIRMKKDEKFMK